MLFAYTLPSTALGEVCIRHGFQGPPLCFSYPPDSPDPLFREASGLLAAGAASACICVAADTCAPVGAAALLLRPGPDTAGLTSAAPPDHTSLWRLAESLVKQA